ncbi:hypothetical protein SAY87_014879 [Trapa incisa]|uniref:Peptidase A1 domain-containing protein n=1 Tax=Trapa incisa TaxID=236973 RepID=A0AAN7GWA4_9MYRT|nr:hypothetical protein SAY87_014879 [Trapa incisa]
MAGSGVSSSSSSSHPRFLRFISVPHLLLLLALLVASTGNPDGARGKASLRLNLRSFLEQKTDISSSSKASRSCISQRSRQRNGAIILEIIHRDHCSGQKTTTWYDEAEKTLTSDDARVRSIQSRIKSMISRKKDEVSELQIPLTSGIKLQTLNYIVSVALGGRKMSVIVDTGSDLTWVQCQPCRVCYTQQDPMFNPSISPSYRSISCNSSTCQSLLFEAGNSGICSGMSPQSCSYSVTYSDGSHTRGELGLDTLSLGTVPVNNFIFGCGRDNKGLFGGASGLMGLGRSSISLISQTSAMFGGVFSYCLPSAGAASTGSLVFGGDSSVYKNSTPFSYADINLNQEMPTFYFLNLTGVRVGGVALESPSFGNSGILIDSGTVISRLQPSIYRALKGEFLRQFSGFPSAPPFSILDTCFNLTSYQEVDIPEIKMHFGDNAQLAVDLTGVFYFAKPDASQVCLAVASLTYENDVGIIGNYQQKNQRIIYDTQGNKLGIGKETCSFM